MNCFCYICYKNGGKAILALDVVESPMGHLPGSEFHHNAPRNCCWFEKTAAVLNREQDWLTKSKECIYWRLILSKLLVMSKRVARMEGSCLRFFATTQGYEYKYQVSTKSSLSFFSIVAIIVRKTYCLPEYTLCTFIVFLTQRISLPIDGIPQKQRPFFPPGNVNHQEED